MNNDIDMLLKGIQLMNVIVAIEESHELGYITDEQLSDLQSRPDLDDLIEMAVCEPSRDAFIKDKLPAYFTDGGNDQPISGLVS